MRYYLENEHLHIGVNAIGAELCHLQSKKSNIEYIWQADPDIWGNHAPILFPIVGGLKEDKYIFEGQEYHLPRHGFIRRNDQLKLVEYNKTDLKLQLSSSPITLNYYPFEFDFQISFRLLDKTLKITHKIINKDDKTMYFSLGGHPAFNCPLKENEKYDDYFLEFEHKEYLNTWNLDKNGMIKEEGDLVMNQTNKLNLHLDLFNNDAIIFKNLKSRQVSLSHKNRGPQLTVKFKDFPSLGIWAKPKAPFICIESWLGYADSSDTNQIFAEKEAILSLEAGKAYTASYSIKIED
ncbi:MULTISPECIES: aldose 1-epimerase family protein [unclassified Lentimicrobium]|uniref:aldose 1-epimerase family protein n=1 Tax=unclassified Lentimicrobium TaxID=2677434 RepID=UPI00155362D9|nr:MULTISPECIES: aldose 1-epimerase family protein [unclassified Lentimicrobium]NPD44543.1 aldose 1-epimerase family protein [Lentimicrobium sp. S6]NPD85640.1 aldose 1-epimerase family protein [Lentimicrobium sp. L6]